MDRIPGYPEGMSGWIGVAMSSVGRARRFECSLTSQELAKEELYVLRTCADGRGGTLDVRYFGIIEDNKVRGYLRSGIPSDSLEARCGRTIGITSEGRELIDWT